jgi:hypothetical protein
VFTRSGKKCSLEATLEIMSVSYTNKTTNRHVTLKANVWQIFLCSRDKVKANVNTSKEINMEANVVVYIAGLFYKL